MKQISISYVDIKRLADEFKLEYYYVDFTEAYGLFIYDKGRDIIFDALIKKDSGSDEIDFNANIKPYSTQATNTNEVISKAEQQFKPLLKVLIDEENSKEHTGGHYQCLSYELNITAQTGWTEKDISFPFSISLLAAFWINKSINEGDEVNFTVGENTVIGSITQDISASSTIITISKTVLDNVAIGYYISLTDGTNTDDVGRIISIDKETKQITVETPTTNSFLVSTPTYVRMTIKIVSHLRFVGDNVPIIIGESKIGASFIPANTILKAKYNNKSGTAKTFSFVLEYLY